MTIAQVACDLRREPALVERTVGGLHAFLLDEVTARVSKHARVLDVGCGTGAWLSRLRHAGYLDLHGIDLDHAARSVSRVEFTVVDLEDVHWPLESNSFDFITAIEVVEHIGNRSNFLRNINRCLSIDGSALLTTPNVHNLASRMRFVLTNSLRQYDEKADPTHFQPVFLHPFQLLLRREGFRMEYLTTYPPNGTLLWSRPISRYLLKSVRALFPDALPGEVLLIWLTKEREVIPGNVERTGSGFRS
jgi:2-polyprenyl-3-methyl-5-hydroxy-6-metoxy-1,4-benzoquinol methylase